MPRRLERRSAAPRGATPRATSRRARHRAGSPRSAPPSLFRQKGSSCLPFGEKGGQIDRMALQFFEEDEESEVDHALRVEDSVEMVALVLHDARVEPVDSPLDYLAVEATPSIADREMPRHDAAQPGHGQ